MAESLLQQQQEEEKKDDDFVFYSKNLTVSNRLKNAETWFVERVREIRTACGHDNDVESVCFAQMLNEKAAELGNELISSTGWVLNDMVHIFSLGKPNAKQGAGVRSANPSLLFDVAAMEAFKKIKHDATLACLHKFIFKTGKKWMACGSKSCQMILELVLINSKRVRNRVWKTAAFSKNPNTERLSAAMRNRAIYRHCDCKEFASKMNHPEYKPTFTFHNKQIADSAPSKRRVIADSSTDGEEPDLDRSMQELWESLKTTSEEEDAPVRLPASPESDHEEQDVCEDDDENAGVEAEERTSLPVPLKIASTSTTTTTSSSSFTTSSIAPTPSKRDHEPTATSAPSTPVKKKQKTLSKSKKVVSLENLRVSRPPGQPGFFLCTPCFAGFAKDCSWTLEIFQNFAVNRFEIKLTYMPLTGYAEKTVVIGRCVTYDNAKYYMKCVADKICPPTNQ